MPARSRTVFPLVPRYRRRRAAVRRRAEPPPRPRLRRRRLARLRPRRPDLDDRLARERAALDRARPRRVRRPRAVRGGGAARRRALRPPALDGALPAAVPVALEAGRGRASATRADRRERGAPTRAVAYLDYAGAAARGGEPYWLRAERPRRAASGSRRAQREIAALRRAGGRARRAALEFLGRFRSELSSGTFVFVVSDFLGPSLAERRLADGRRPALGGRAGHRPGPVWEQSFPLVGSLVAPARRPRDGRGARGAPLAA